MSNSLFDQTLKLIQNRPAHLKITDIAKETQIGYSWLCMFHQGRVANPTYHKLQRLHDYLVSKQSA